MWNFGCFRSISMEKFLFWYLPALLMTNEYEKLSNEELAKLVAEIKREFNPTLSETQKTYSSAITPSKPITQTLPTTSKIEARSVGSTGVAASVSAAKQQDTHDIKSSQNQERECSDPNSFDAQITELKKDLQNYFTQGSPVDRK